MFEKILIANRGEIACRVIRTCQKLGVQTVGIYSDADQSALHVRMADSAYRVGPAPVAQSYLQMDAIIDIALQAGAEAIHPGYGLLSENAEFARKCEQAGITFIGPTPDVIEQMGSKIHARRTLQQAGIAIVPGTLDPVQDAEEAVRIAEEIGFPVMLKASAGGGGIGMQLVHDAEILRKAFASNANRVKAYFGDSSMYVEKYIPSPRHIEAQVLADHYGNNLFLWERECSIQRRHQKVVEEAPSPVLTSEQRKTLEQMAVQACKVLGYRNAGTLECLLDADGNLYFLEMNTRLQVEHPVTEEILGLDLVEWQLRIASGEALTIKQNQIQARGHAIECRIYAENPDTFLPSPGTIQAMKQPNQAWVRHEMAVETGMTVTPYYDPMIAKMIVTGKDRHEAIIRLREALAEYEIEGIRTNLPFLQRLADNPHFEAGETTTDFIERFMRK
jgi:acetyl-CoA carboxylase, biotin carboxylase subunit